MENSLVNYEANDNNANDNITKKSKNESKDKKINNIDFISKNKLKKETQSSILNYFHSSQNDNKSINNNKSKKDEHIINFNFENIKVDEKKNKGIKDIKSHYMKKNANKEKQKKTKIDKDSKLDKKETKDNEEIVQEKKINNESKNQEIINKNNNEEEPKVNLSQKSSKNFNETLFNYKEYSLINNNPIKKKVQFECELKETKKMKDISIRQQRKKWIKKDSIKKEININIFENKTKALFSKQNEKSKNIFGELNIILEEESNKKFTQKIGIEHGTDHKKEKEEDETDLNSDLIKSKKSQDDFNIDLGNSNNTNRASDVFIEKYKHYLKNKNNKKNKDIEKINKNSESDDNFMFFDDNIL